MARPLDDTTSTDPRPGVVHDDGLRHDDATTRTGRTSVRETEMKRHRGGSTLWIILAVILAILLALWLFSGAFSSNPGVGTGVEPVPGAAVDGAVTDGAIVPEGATIDGAPVGTDTNGVIVDQPATGGTVIAD